MKFLHSFKTKQLYAICIVNNYPIMLISKSDVGACPKYFTESVSGNFLLEMVHTN